MNITSFKQNLRKDFSASIVVFLVALPLCLGIALASGAPLYAGLISGIIGGIVVGSISNSALGVSGPAAGLAVIVYAAIADIGSYQIFLVAVVLGGALQILMGLLRAGIITKYIPISVIKGMLAGIGILIFMKQLDIAFGVKGIPNILKGINVNITIVTLVSLAILLLWQTKYIKNNKILALIPGPLLAVISGILLQAYAFNFEDNFLVKLPVADSFDAFIGNFTLPNFKDAFSNSLVYQTAVVIAIVASLETLLCVEASDKQDTKKRKTNTNLELIAQGVGNMCSGLIGGLPITQVIVRSSANQQAGGQSKTSTVLHGILLLLSSILIPTLLNLIPLATLAAILLIIGYKLASPSVFKAMFKEGWSSFLPFIVTILGIVTLDLLQGIGLGILVALMFYFFKKKKQS